VASLDTRAIGLAIVAMGGGRRREGDRIDPRVGFTAIAAPGARVGPGRPLAVVHAATVPQAEAAAAALTAAITLGDAPPQQDLIRERLG
jgi:thymidine phosphorylase